jgi:hypothetical protein
VLKIENSQHQKSKIKTCQISNYGTITYIYVHTYIHTLLLSGMALKQRKERGGLVNKWRGGINSDGTTTAATSQSQSGGRLHYSRMLPKLSPRSRFLLAAAMIIVWNILYPYGTISENISIKEVDSQKFIETDEFGRSTTAHEPFNPLLPRLIRIDDVATGTFFEDKIFRYEAIRPSASTFKSSVCNTSTGSIPILTNFSASAISDLSSFILIDNESVLKRSNSSEKPYATCQFRNYQFSGHFPHFMQQFFRCFSFWLHHSDKTPVFVPTAKRSKHMRRAKLRPFTAGLLKLLRQLDIQMVEPSEVGTYERQSPFHDTESISCAVLGPLHNPNAISFQVESPKHMNTLRDRVLAALSINGTGDIPGGCVSQNSMPRIAVLNRKGSRQLANPQEVASAIEKALKLPYSVPEIFFEGLSFEEQTVILSAVDIIVTPHGAQETGMIMMPDCGGVFEIIPGDYYYPNFFGTLAATSGLEHGFVYLGKDVAYHFYNVSVRNPELCPRVDDVVKGVEGLLGRWKTCCLQKLKSKSIQM